MMKNILAVAKAIAGALSAGIAAYSAAAVNGHVGQAGWVAVAVAVVGAFGIVFTVPNKTTPVTSGLSVAEALLGAQTPSAAAAAEPVIGPPVTPEPAPEPAAPVAAPTPSASAPPTA